MGNTENKIMLNKWSKKKKKQEKKRDKRKPEGGYRQEQAPKVC